MSVAETDYYNPGDIIYEGKHIAHVIFYGYRKEYCDYCCIRNLKVKLCGKCRYVSYCDKECQTSAWPDHKLECKKLNYLLSLDQCDLVLLISRVIRKLKSEKGKISEKIGFREMSFDDIPLFDGLFYDPSDEFYRNYLLAVCHSLELYMSSSNFEITHTDALNFCNKVVYNKAPLYYDKEYGMFLCIGRSAFKLSCMPNAVELLTSKLTVEIRATQKICKVADLKNVYLPVLSIISSFSKPASMTSDFVHRNTRCIICIDDESILTKYLREDVAIDALDAALTIIGMILHGLESEKPGIRKKIDTWLRMHKGVLADTNIFRLKLLVWRVLLDHENLYVVKRWETTLIALIKSIYGEQSFELYNVYNRFAEIYSGCKKMKIAKGYMLKCNELGALYNLPQNYEDELLK